MSKGGETMAKLSKAQKLQRARTLQEKYKEYYRHTPTWKNRKQMKRWTTRVKNLSK